VMGAKIGANVSARRRVMDSNFGEMESDGR